MHTPPRLHNYLLMANLVSDCFEANSRYLINVSFKFTRSYKICAAGLCPCIFILCMSMCSGSPWASYCSVSTVSSPRNCFLPPCLACHFLLFLCSFLKPVPAGTLRTAGVCWLHNGPRLLTAKSC